MSHHTSTHDLGCFSDPGTPWGGEERHVEQPEYDADTDPDWGKHKEKELSTENIQKIILQRIASYRPSIWSWPHDTFMNEPWGYAIHQASVRAWNDEGRRTECVAFLRDWATLENISAAIQMYPPLARSPEHEEVAHG